MKKQLLLLVMILLAGNYVVNAQVESRNFFVGANIADFNWRLNQDHQFEMLINPKVAGFIVDKVALGGYFTIGINTANGEGTDFTYGIGALGRYYGGTTTHLEKHARLFAEVSAGVDGFNPRSGKNTNGLGIGLGPGLAYFITPNVGLEGLLKYNVIIGFGEAVTNHLLSLNVGFQVYLRSKTAKAAWKNLK